MKINLGNFHAQPKIKINLEKEKITSKVLGVKMPYFFFKVELGRENEAQDFHAQKSHGLKPKYVCFQMIYLFKMLWN